MSSKKARGKRRQQHKARPKCLHYYRERIYRPDSSMEMHDIVPLEPAPEPVVKTPEKTIRYAQPLWPIWRDFCHVERTGNRS